MLAKIVKVQSLKFYNMHMHIVKVSVYIYINTCKSNSLIKKKFDNALQSLLIPVPSSRI